jgi:hypothetical protein
MTHTEFLCSLVRSVRATGAANTLAQVRADRPAFDRGRYHDTRAVFFVWAVDRLVEAGLSDIGVLGHPLTDSRSVRSWWSIGVLESVAAADGFVPSDLALAHEPQPVHVGALVAV